MVDKHKPMSGAADWKSRATRAEAERDEAKGRVEKLEKVMEAAEWCVEVADTYNWCVEEHGQRWFMCSPGKTLDELVRSARGELIAALAECGEVA